MAAFPVWKLRPLPSLKYDVTIKNVTGPSKQNAHHKQWKNVAF